MVVTALGRLNLSIAGKYIQDEFRFTTQTMGWILGAFSFGYAFFQIPCGWGGDRFGPRATLTVAILWWSTFTLLMSFVPSLFHGSLWSLALAFAIVRFFTGAGEAASYPNANKIVAFWTTKEERGIGSSLLLGGVGAGGIFAPILLTKTIERSGWRSSFVLCSLIAAAIALVWFVYITDRPEEHGGVNSAELKLLGSMRRGNSHSFQLGGTPWNKFFSNRSVWGLILSYFCHGYTPYIFFTWFFIYLTRVRGLTVTRGGLWGSTPFIAMTLMAPLGGWLSDKAVARFGRRRGRRSTVWIGMTASGLMLLIGGRAVGDTSAILLLALAAGFSSFAAPSWWATCIDMSPNYSGSLSGLMNTCANIAGGVAPILTAHLAMAFGWTRALDVAALVSFTGGVIWLVVDASDNLEVDAERKVREVETI